MQNERSGLWMHEMSIAQQKTRAGNPTRVFKKKLFQSYYSSTAASWNRLVRLLALSFSKSSREPTINFSNSR